MTAAAAQQWFQGAHDPSNHGSGGDQRDAPVEGGRHRPADPIALGPRGTNAFRHERRTDRALAEAATLLTLSKKARELWRDEDENTRTNSEI